MPANQKNVTQVFWLDSVLVIFLDIAGLALSVFFDLDVISKAPDRLWKERLPPQGTPLEAGLIAGQEGLVLGRET